MSTALVLVAFFAIVAFVLERSFRESAEQTLKEKLQVQIYALLSAADLKDSGELTMPPNLPEPRLTNPGSGLYGFIQLIRKTPTLIWHSPSAIGLGQPTIPPDLSPGHSVFLLDDQGRYALHYNVIWSSRRHVEREFVFTVTEDIEFVGNQVQQFRASLSLWLLVIGFCLILIQFLVLRWSLKPLRIMVKDLAAIEKGEKNRLDGVYSTELQGLAENLNTLINSARTHLERYRNTLADLAHSLKTPLAILRGCSESFIDNKETVQEQINRMNDIVDYQLQRAAAKGEQKITGGADLSAVITKIISSLKKVYLDKHIVFSVSVPPSCLIYCEEGDLYEIAGNLLDNACKWCQGKVNVNISLKNNKANGDFSVMLQIDDDGAGIPEGKLREILKRGVRADENIHGHGIGMAVVNELVGLLGGKLLGLKSKVLGGMCWRVYWP
ncbi:MAG: ATP-binding protein [Methylococcaceae bacterium]|jgi:two-component system sensor histidine kinase PhoQ